MKQLIVLILLLFTGLTAKAQYSVAIFDPAGRALSETTKTLIVGEISRIVMNNNRFILVEREMINHVLREHNFQAVYTDPDAAVAAGRMIGADYVCIIKVVDESGQYFIECRFVDVETAQVVVYGMGMATSRSITDIRLGAREAAVGLASGETARAIRNEVSERKKRESSNARESSRLITEDIKYSKKKNK
ncbi:MAG: penicillin-binding protein activator LpoB [Tannerellaceae bacterium]|jgi:hypothetical protein|nr:penicillin-binding protein activator LpoB [Tannerellaceae bacterium]